MRYHLYKVTPCIVCKINILYATHDCCSQVMYQYFIPFAALVLLLLLLLPVSRRSSCKKAVSPLVIICIKKSSDDPPHSLTWCLASLPCSPKSPEDHQAAPDGRATLPGQVEGGRERQALHHRVRGRRGARPNVSAELYTMYCSNSDLGEMWEPQSYKSLRAKERNGEHREGMGLTNGVGLLTWQEGGKVFFSSSMCRA